MQTLTNSVIGVNNYLKSAIPWLTTAFGITLRRKDNESGIIYPGIYKGNGEYSNLMPNTDYGNFCFWHLYDPKAISVENGHTILSCQFSLIFWYDISKIYEDSIPLQTDEVISDIITALKAKGNYRQYADINVTQVYEDFQQVYKDYAFDKYSLSNYQYLTYPYMGVRLMGTIKNNALCL